MMKLRFDTCLMTDTWEIKTQTLNGVPDIVVREPDDLYSYDDMLHIVRTAHHIERSQYGWSVQFTKGGQNKEVFLRGRHIDKCNQTTSAKQSIFKWLEFLYDANITLF